MVEIESVDEKNGAVHRFTAKKNLRIATRRRLVGRSPTRDDLSIFWSQCPVFVKATNAPTPLSAEADGGRLSGNIRGQPVEAMAGKYRLLNKGASTCPDEFSS